MDNGKTTVVAERLEITPRESYVLIERMDVEQQQAGDIVMPENSGLTKNFAKVLKVGPSSEKLKIDTSDLNEGDIVMVDVALVMDPSTGRQRASLIMVDQKRFLVMATEIVAVVEIK